MGQMPESVLDVIRQQLTRVRLSIENKEADIAHAIEYAKKEIDGLRKQKLELEELLK